MKFLRNLFGRRSRRVEAYKTTYRSMDREQRVRFRKIVEQYASHGFWRNFWRNQDIINRCEAASEVLREEAAALTVLRMEEALLHEPRVLH